MLNRLKQDVKPCLDARRWYVGFSGGLDSTVLLYALQTVLADIPSPKRPELMAVHINHGMQRDADRWQQHCEAVCRSLQIAFCSHTVTVGKANAEQSAREARFAVFAALLQAGDCLFLAHHQQDQAETLLYRLFRGAGVRGLSAMQCRRAFAKGWLLRPLLPYPRDVLLAFAREKRLDWVEDPSNQDSAYDRNYLRHRLIPVIEQRWPSAAAMISRAAGHLQEADQLLAELAGQDCETLGCGDDGEPWLALAGLAALSAARQKNLLRYWLLSCSLQPSADQLHALQHDVINAAADAVPELLLGDVLLRRFAGRLYVTKPGPHAVPEQTWQTEQVLQLPGIGRFALTEPRSLCLQVRARQGGERLRPAGSRHTRKLKTWLQEQGVPPWRRSRLPLFYQDDELLAVADLTLTESGAELLQGAQILRLPESTDCPGVPAHAIVQKPA